MARKLWTSYAPVQAQQYKVTFSGNVAETSDILFKINQKPVYAEAKGDTVEDLVTSCVEALSDSELPPEYGEVEWSLAQIGSGDPYLLATAATPGVPFSLSASAPYPTVDVDTVQDGGPGVNEIQQFYFNPAPSGGQYRISWDLGSGAEFSDYVNYSATAATLEAAIVTGMASLDDEDVSVTGSGTPSSPFKIELMGDFAETVIANVLVVDVSQLTGNGVVTVSTVTDGGVLIPGGTVDVNDTFTDTDSTAITAHTSDSSDTYSELSTGSGSVPDIQSNKLRATNCSRTYRVVGTLAADAAMQGTFTLPSATGSPGCTVGFTFRSDGTETSPTVSEGFEIRFNRPDGQTKYKLTTFSNGAPMAGEVGGLLDPGTYTLRITFIGTSLQIHVEDSGGTPVIYPGPLDIGSYNQTEQVHGLYFVVPSGETVLLDNFTVEDTAVSDETWSIYTNGSGGTFTLTEPSGPTTSSALSAGAGTAAMATQLAALYGGTWTVTGIGTPASPWVCVAGGAAANTNLTAPTGDGTNLTGGFSSPTSRSQVGAAATGTIWNVIVWNATAGNFQLEFLGDKTGNIAYNAANTDVDTALEALDSIPTGEVAVTGSGTSGDPYVITLSGTLAGTAHPQLVAYNENLTGTSITVTVSEITQSKGPNHWDDDLNWIDLDTGLVGVPVTGDTVFIQRGSITESILYGLDQSAVDLDTMIIDAAFEGYIGNAVVNPLGYLEYRDTHLKIGLQGNKRIDIGSGQGSGSSRINIDTGTDEVHMTEYISQAGVAPDLYAVNWKGSNTASVIEVLNGTFAAASNAGEAAEFKLIQRGGSVFLGRGVDLTALDRTGGNLIADNSALNGNLFSTLV